RARAAPDRARDRRVSRPHRLQRPSGARAAAAQRLRRHGLRHRHGRDGRVRADGGGAAACRDRLDAHPARVRPRFRFRPAARHGGRRGWVPHQEGVRLRTAALRGQHGDLAAEGGSVSGRPIRVLVADDSTTLRTALVALLSEDPSLAIVGQAADGVEAVEKARALRPDVITMDVNMPRLDGLGATAAIMAEAPSHVLGALPRDLPVPLLLAQHIATGFSAGLVRWFTSVCSLRVVIARDGDLPVPGTVYLPPDGCDVELGREGRIHAPRSSGLHCPSGNKLLASLARVYGSRAAGFVLTGMGDDGAQGLLELKKAGGATYAQDEQTSVVFGMPQAAHACGAARALLPLESIAPAILELCRAKPGSTAAARPRG